MAYICKDCGLIIEDEHVVHEQEPSEAWGHTVYEDWYLCPRCGESVKEYFGRGDDDALQCYEPIF